MLWMKQHFHDKVSIQEVALKHLKRLVANDIRPKIVYIRRSPRTESSFAS